MSPHLFLTRAVEPGLSLLPGYMTSDCAKIWLMTIAGQETNLQARAQKVAKGPPPALGFWQFEQAGVDAVLRSQAKLAQGILETWDIPVSEAHAALQYNDPVACAFARLLLWSDPAPLPLASDTAAGWNAYLKTWRPGKPDAARWPSAHSVAMTAVCAQIS